MARLWLERPEPAQAIASSDRDIGDKAVMYAAGPGGEPDRVDLTLTVRIEQADLDRLGIGGKHRDVDARLVVGGRDRHNAERFRRAGADVSGHKGGILLADKVQARRD